VAETTKLEAMRASLDKRLDELFNEDEAGFGDAASGQAEDNPLNELKKIVLSIDWEITPEGLDSFLEQVLLLQTVYRDDQVISILLRMLGSLGKYIQSSRSWVHPATFAVLNSVFSRLEKIVTTPNLPATTRRSLLQAEVDSFQRLRAKIMQRRAARQGPGPGVVARPAANQPVTAEMLARVAAELKELIHREMEVLRELLTSLARR
jgi:hypothetical protein